MGGLAWAFDLRRKRNADGSEVPVHWNDYTPLLIAKPMPFEFEAMVRSEAVREQLKVMWIAGKGEDDVDDEGIVREKDVQAQGGEKVSRAWCHTTSVEEVVVQVEKGDEEKERERENILARTDSLDVDMHSNRGSDSDSDVRSGGTSYSSGQSRSECDSDNDDVGTCEIRLKADVLQSKMDMVAVATGTSTGLRL